jgi:hypothetical protein
MLGREWSNGRAVLDLSSSVIVGSNRDERKDACSQKFTLCCLVHVQPWKWADQNVKNHNQLGLPKRQSVKHEKRIRERRGDGGNTVPTGENQGWELEKFVSKQIATTPKMPACKTESRFSSDSPSALLGRGRGAIKKYGEPFLQRCDKTLSPSCHCFHPHAVNGHSFTRRPSKHILPHRKWKRREGGTEWVKTILNKLYVMG